MEILDNDTEFKDCYETSYFGEGCCEGVRVTFIYRIELRNIKLMSDVIKIVSRVIPTKII